MCGVYGAKVEIIENESGAKVFEWDYEYKRVKRGSAARKSLESALKYCRNAGYEPTELNSNYYDELPQRSVS
ncbi:hypothetical protein JOD43_003907 [Pullulanibacillus pueri]|uniref:Uncharacterized protein n=1 Tax=Pullulanibacillus pueri TaxID=1437324 RepID=A0A8J2ZYF4_9BACL|nr:hypothetical protein [Pullulanibacillus pueri]GGH85147.1 hypothetical protein GCM10007096_29860 [Pullulanibacillus pueri]